VTQLPDVPVIAETVPGFESTTWVSIFAPAGTPRAIIDQLNAELGNAMRDPYIARKSSDNAESFIFYPTSQHERF
jgi:tripartite-type tricarboxylate transporter receptor subunit TctC